MRITPKIFLFSSSPFRGDRGFVSLAPEGAGRKRKEVQQTLTAGVNAWAREKALKRLSSLF
jgi:hypothetical protein